MSTKHYMCGIVITILTLVLNCVDAEESPKKIYIIELQIPPLQLQGMPLEVPPADNTQLIKSFDAIVANAILALTNKVSQSQNLRFQFRERIGHSQLLIIEADQKTADYLRNLPEIKSIYENESAEPQLDSSIPIIDVDPVFSAGFAGGDWVVAVVDSGVDAKHQFLLGKVIHEACFSTEDEKTNKVSACPNKKEEEVGPGAASYLAGKVKGYYHGTHVAGIVAGLEVMLGDLHLQGVARGANIIAVQAFHILDSKDDLTLCFPSLPPCIRSDTRDQIRALEHIIALAETKQFRIAAVNMSLGAAPRPQCDDHPMKSQIDRLWKHGIPVVVASGNQGDSTDLGFPACISTAVAVGATSDEDEIASFSNSSEMIDLLAPGIDVRSSVPGDGYIVDRGTSQAAPHVAGAIADLRSAFPNKAIDDILAALESTGILVRDERNGVTKPRIDVGLAYMKLDGTHQ